MEQVSSPAQAIRRHQEWFGNRLSASDYRIEENNGNVELVRNTP